MKDLYIEQKILLQLGEMNSETTHLRSAVDELKVELQRLRESQVSRDEHKALDQRVKGLEAGAIQFAEFRATVRAALGLGGSGVAAGLAGTALHFFT